MKYFSLVLVLISLLLWNKCLGQNASNSVKPSELVQNAKVKGTFTPITLWTQFSQRSTVEIPADIKDFTLLKPEIRNLTQILSSDNSQIELVVPQHERQSLILELVEVKLFSEDFKVSLADGQKPKEIITQGKHFRGIVQGDRNSVVSLSVFENEMMGLISMSGERGNLVLGKLDENEIHILYRDTQIAEKFSFNCSAKDEQIEYTHSELYDDHLAGRTLTDCVRLYLEVDYDIYQNKGSSVANVNTYITAVMNQVATLYANENINTVVSEIVVWTQPSPYNSTSSIGMLNAFTAHRQGFNGDLAQLLSFKASGGVAYVDGLCRTNPDYSMSYSGISATFQSVPTYSWTVEVITHEFGHLFGSQHTHACVWNGNNTAIDGCYAPEGNCPNPGIPTGGGTIMSYCHLTSTGINFTNGFGLQPGNLMRARVTNANCLQACTGNPPPPPPPPPTCTQTQMVLTIRLDNYPTETSWNIKNASGTTVYLGSQYNQANSTQTIDLCLPTACYTFTIFDSYGDGICCAYGSGFYNIKQGTTTLISGGQFGSSEVKSFCAQGSSTPTCNDGIKNGNETGVDCGGSCPACPTCNDGIKNGNETGVDCGGSCAPCPTCSDGIKNGNETGVDCGGSCPACPTCNDGIKNGNETGVDCGGSCPACTSCNDGIKNGNETGVDCGGSCPACPTCNDGIKNGNETGVDCGGSCPACPTCNDDIKNGSETGIDCGGPTCPPCNVQPPTVTTLSGHYFETGWDGWTSGGSNCSRYSGSYSPEGNFSIRIRNGTGELSSMTSAVYNLTTYDSVTIEFKYRAISMETGEAFWLRYYNGSSWSTLKTFTRGTDFNINVVYTVTVKVAGTLATGARFRFQNSAGDNTDQIYIDAVIVKGYKSNTTVTCTDGIKNGQETGIDCGGPTCPACPTCSDGIKNGAETGIDCGGPTCPACPTCTDGIKNGAETAVDCGGPVCPPCNPGGTTVQLSGHYYETGWDGWIDGGIDCFRYGGSQSPEGLYSVRLRDNEGEFSAMTSPTYNLSAFNSIQVEFRFRAVSMEAGKDFWLRYFNGSTWTTVAAFVSGVHFNNNTLYTTTVTFTGPFSPIAKFRFQCDADDNTDIVYIDAVVIRGTTGSTLIENIIDINADEVESDVLNPEISIDNVKIFPNPSSHLLHIESEINLNKIIIFNSKGQNVMILQPDDLKVDLDIERFISGLYFIQLETESGVVVRKFIKN